MSAFSEIENGLYRWDGVDADHGFPIVGYVAAIDGGLLLIDPPGTSGSVEEISKLGVPQAIVVTGKWHVRGAGKWKALLGIPIGAPDTAEGELAEAGTSADVIVGDGYERFGWKAIRFTAGGERRYDEIALWNAERRAVVIGDLIAMAKDGQIDYGPHMFSGIPRSELRPFAERLAELDPRVILSCHLGPREDAAAILERLRSL